MLNCLSCDCLCTSICVCVSVLYLDSASRSRLDDSSYQTSLRPPGTQLVSNLSDDKKALLASILPCVCLLAMDRYNKSTSSSEISSALRLSIRPRPPSLNKYLLSGSLLLNQRKKYALVGFSLSIFWQKFKEYISLLGFDSTSCFFCVCFGLHT